MIQHNDISDAIGRHLVDAGLGYYIRWQGDDRAPPARPFVLFEYVSTGGTDKALMGGSEAIEGYCMASVLGKGGGGPTISNATRSIADEVRSAFTASPRMVLPINGGRVLIRSAAVVGGYNDGAGHRVPVRITFRAF